MTRLRFDMFGHITRRAGSIAALLTMVVCLQCSALLAQGNPEPVTIGAVHSEATTAPETDVARYNATNVLIENEQEALDWQTIDDAEELLANPSLESDLERQFFEEEMRLEENLLTEEDFRMAEEALEGTTTDGVPLEASEIDPEFEKDLDQIFAEEFGYVEDTGPYRLRIGDKMFLSIYGEPNTGRPVVVDSTGSVNYLLVGRVFVLGKTIDELRETLNESIRAYFKHAFIAITPIEFGSQYYTIMGEVRSPGRKVLFGETSLLKALASAGGLNEGSFRSQTIELADLSHAFLARNGDYIPVDFERLIVHGDTSEDIDLRSGDYIFVPSSLYREINVLGEVNAPTTINFINTMSLVEAIAWARGLTDRASSRMVIVRGSLANPVTFHVDVNLIIRGFEKDFLLQPGDIVYAPPRQFTEFRDMVRAGISAFVGAAASSAGAEVFECIHPHAADTTNNNNFIPVIPIGP